MQIDRFLHAQHSLEYDFDLFKSVETRSVASAWSVRAAAHARFGERASALGWGVRGVRAGPPGLLLTLPGRSGQASNWVRPFLLELRLFLGLWFHHIWKIIACYVLN